ncbi:hypothetical protein TTHERM_00469240 (macronuclear) [Tetrahymena thermophila SB210]|uniref:Uncharacterized protein n=1 Tax=Tetrahymena thermophila (strain SB210) TaxID=312017 RepID=I7MIZ7_TETTS|nr:hypothetical protein TTHERM_00469240 [Tetrahymena thermophila SB210]EAS04875.2 hypothetical protein TTHERM_00469240 [Tetrahymena thermophila SB210]|eukprot:XP_001025120.2 hypothetical protein TTHERM_00469240 [Tetrahymena thermophila SB210]
MSNKNQRNVKVIEQEGEIDEDVDNQVQQQISNSDSQKNNLSRTNIQGEHVQESQQIKVKNECKEKVFDDIIGLKSYFEEYKSKELNEISDKISNLKIAQENNKISIQKVKENISEEEKIKQIRQVFQLAPLYILKLKGLKNRMAKIEDKLSSAKNKLNLQNTQNNK